MHVILVQSVYLLSVFHLFKGGASVSRSYKRARQCKPFVSVKGVGGLLRVVWVEGMVCSKWKVVT